MPKLSKAQVKALEGLQDGKERSAYTLGSQVSLTTLRGLRRRGLVESYAGAAYIAFPRNGVKWTITAQGQEALKSLPPIDKS